MNISEVFKNKLDNVSDSRILEIKRLKDRIGWSTEGVVDWMIEFQEATGTLLKSDPRTKRKGELKMIDAKMRKREKQILKQKGVI
jgi:hypothetical protein